MSADYDQPSVWLGEERVYGWHVNTPASSPAFLMRTIPTDGMMQAQDYAHRVQLTASQLLANPDSIKLYVNNSSLGIMLYAKAAQPIPEVYYVLAAAINNALVTHP